MLTRVRQSRRLAFVLGFVGWLILWSAYYIVVGATEGDLNLAAAAMCALSATVASLVVVVLLFLMKLGWAALGYVAAMALNGIGLLLVGSFDILYLLCSFPFFLPSTLRP